MRSCILLSTYNGEKYLSEQIESLLIQDADIIIRDDGSKDNTVKILQKYRKKHSDKITVLESTGNQKVARSFIILLNYAVQKEYDFYFFADQDDVWIEGKCSRAIDSIAKKDGPSLYFTKKKIVDSNLRDLCTDDEISFRGDFWDAFEQSNVSGCVMCLNRELAELVLKNDFVNKKYLHDAYIYRLAICINANIVYDDWESILYRQHENNVVGSMDNSKIIKRIDRATSRTRKHYMQGIIIDILGLNITIPLKNERIMKLIGIYDRELGARIKLLLAVICGNAKNKTKLIMSIKILSNIL